VERFDACSFDLTRKRSEVLSMIVLLALTGEDTAENVKYLCEFHAIAAHPACTRNTYDFARKRPNLPKFGVGG